jgi:hypothetical protein
LVELQLMMDGVVMAVFGQTRRILMKKKKRRRRRRNIRSRAVMAVTNTAPKRNELARATSVLVVLVVAVVVVVVVVAAAAADGRMKTDLSARMWNRLVSPHLLLRAIDVCPVLRRSRTRWYIGVYNVAFISVNSGTRMSK